MFQSDLGTFETDEEIVAGVNGSSIEDYFTDGVCEVANYQNITGLIWMTENSDRSWRRN